MSLEPKDFITLLTAFGLIVGAIGVGWATWRNRSEESWRKNYERQKNTCTDLTSENEHLRRDLKDTERELERFTQRYFKVLADAEWYEKRHGPIPPDQNTTSRG